MSARTETRAPRWHARDAPIRVGISTCLLGEEVRFDGGHKRDLFLLETLGRFVDWVPVCPEVEAGFGIPRPAIRLFDPGAGGELRVVEVKTGRDRTGPLRRHATRRVRELETADLCGYVLKKDSPSCGMERVRVWRPAGQPRRDGRGVFAAALLDRFPDLPVEEEGRLHDPALRESFVERVFAYRRLRSLFEGRWTPGDLVRFHTAHKLQLMAHSPAEYRALGRLVAEARSHPRAALRERYTSEFMAALRHRATPRRHANVLQHMLGHLRRALDAGSRRELAELIEDYRGGLVPLVVPVTLLRHHVRVHRVAYLEGQVYLEPHPKELMLRNHV